MLENPTVGGAQRPPASDPTATPLVKPYIAPNQRNKLNRRKSGDRTNCCGNETEKNHSFATRNVSGGSDHGDTSSTSLTNDNTRYGPRLITLEGCSVSEASQLMHDRWTAALQCANDSSIDPSERPVVYSEKAPTAWGGQFKLPHQIMSPTGGVGSQMDFLAELRRAKSRSGAITRKTG